MGNIRIIGPRSSGKTTYLAALAYWPDKKRGGKKSNLFKIQAIGDDANELAEKAENIILQGESLAPTPVDESRGIDALPLYQFRIEIKKSFFQKSEQIDLAVRDYPGEIFNELETGLISALHEPFFEECLMADVSGCLIVLTEWCEPNIDKSYDRIIKHFIKQIDSRGRMHNLRLAVAMSKCERGELWAGRLEPEKDLFELYLPNTTKTLRSKITPKNLDFFAISTFGVLHRNDPRPNRKDEMGRQGRNSGLREPSKWQPYGMIAPLYWLSTGKRINYNV